MLNILLAILIRMVIPTGKLRRYCSQIKIVLTDVDGVLTDGGMYYTSDGDIMKKFHVRDGMGVNLLRRNGIPTIIVTKEKSKIIKSWSKKMNVLQVYDGIQNKFLLLEKICKKHNLKEKNFAYIGDDINDVELLKHVGFSAVPSDVSKDMKKIPHYICENSGGSGAFREIADLIIKFKVKSK